MNYDFDELMELFEEEWLEGGITIFCECGNDAFVEPDGEGWCPHCQKTIKNPLIEAALI